MKKIIIILLLFCGVISCNNSSSDPEAYALNPGNGYNGYDPAYNAETKRFFYSPNTHSNGNILIAQFEYMHLYDSVSVRHFNGVENVYKAHLLQFSEDHEELTLVGTELMFDAEKNVIGHETYWNYKEPKSQKVAGGILVKNN